MTFVQNLIKRASLRTMRRICNLEKEYRTNLGNVSPSTICTLFNELFQYNNWLRNHGIKPPDWGETWIVSYDYRNETLILTIP